jgi:hypothetical protein
MTDLIKRLRDGYPTAKKCHEAADALELHSQVNAKFLERERRYEAEIERLRNFIADECIDVPGAMGALGDD